MFHVKQKRVAFRGPAGACLLCRLPTLPLVCFFAPIPPTRARRALFPAGRGRFFVLFCRGLAPPAPLRLSPGGTGYFLPRQCFLPPSPRPPSRREGGNFLFSYARGSAPCIPGAEPGRHWLNRGAPPLASPGRSPDGIGFFCRISAFCPHPPDPLPGGKGEIFVLFCRGLTPPAPLQLNPRSTGSIGGLAPPAPLLLNLRGAGLPGGWRPRHPCG